MNQETFEWPLAREITHESHQKALYKPDSFLQSVENLVERRLAWCPIKGGTRRSEPSSQLEKWIEIQMAHLRIVHQRLHGPDVRLRLSDFPVDKKGKRTITTSRTVLYLVDSTSDLKECLKPSSFTDRVADFSAILDVSLPALLFVTNSIESGGRAFSGDPFTGEVAAYSHVFCHDLANVKVRNFLVYYPHQLYSQFFTAQGQKPANKGVMVIQANVDLLVTSCGVLIDPKKWSVII